MGHYLESKKMIDWKPWFDKNTYIKPRKDWEHSGNGVLYSAIAAIFDPSFGETRYSVVDWYQIGCLMRTPDNAFGNDSHDNYRGLAARCIFYDMRIIPQKILAYGLPRLFVMRNDPIATYEAWLWRFPDLWLFMFCAAFPKAKWLAWFPLWIIQKFQKPKADDASGRIQQWLFQISFRKLYGENGSFRSWKEKAALEAAFADQYDLDHPFQALIKEWK